MTNLIILLVSAIVILLVIKFSVRHSKAYMSSDKINFNLMIEFTMIYCLAVIAAVTINGTMKPWSKVSLHVANMFKVEAMTAVAFIWLFYVMARLKINITKIQKAIIWLPFVVATILVLINPFTSAVFDIDSHNVYSRCTGVYIHWGVAFLYLFTAMVVAIIWARKAKNRLEKRKIIPLIAFPIFPAVFAFIQMFLYGTYTTQIGLTIGFILIYISNLKEMVDCDYLTGLNNANEMEKYITNRLEKEGNLSLSIMIFDVNHFKLINEKKGVKVGDRILVTSADCLRSACEELDSKLFLCRSKADDFVIIGPKMSIDRIAKITSTVRRYANIANDANPDAKVSFSVGTEIGDCISIGEFDTLVARAKKRLDEEKTRAPAYEG